MAENILTSNKFKFVLTGTKFKNNKFELMVTSANIPGMQLGLVNQGTSVRIIERPGDSLIFNDLTVTFIVGENLEDWKTIFDWIVEMRDSMNPDFKEMYSDASLVLLTNKNNPNVVVNFMDIFPYNLTDVFMNNNSDNLITCEVSFKYKNFTIGSS